MARTIKALLRRTKIRIMMTLMIEIYGDKRPDQQQKESVFIAYGNGNGNGSGNGNENSECVHRFGVNNKSINYVN